jgi:hypothetical protein
VLKLDLRVDPYFDLFITLKVYVFPLATEPLGAFYLKNSELVIVELLKDT